MSDFSTEHNKVVWLDIPVVDRDRAVLVYFNVDGRLQAAVGKVSGLGGEVTQPVHTLGPHGFRAVVRDSKCNRLAIHGRTEI